MAKGVARGPAPQLVNILKEIWPYIGYKIYAVDLERKQPCISVLVLLFWIYFYKQCTHLVPPKKGGEETPMVNHVMWRF